MAIPDLGERHRSSLNFNLVPLATDGVIILIIFHGIVRQTSLSNLLRHGDVETQWFNSAIFEDGLVRLFRDKTGAGLVITGTRECGLQLQASSLPIYSRLCLAARVKDWNDLCLVLSHNTITLSTAWRGDCTAEHLCLQFGNAA